MPKGTDHTPPIMVPGHGRHFSRSQSLCHSHCNRSSSFRRHTLHSSSSHCSSLHCPLASGCPHHHSYHDTNWHSCTPSHTCHFSHRHHSCHSTDKSQSHSSNSHNAVQETHPRQAELHPRPSATSKPHNSKTVTIQDFPSDYSSDLDSNSDPPSSDEDEQGGHSANNHYSIGLVSDCPTVMVHAGKRFKALIDSGAALSLAHTCVYNMIEECYKTKILPAAVHLKAADGS